ncbi:hypothetical protein [Specibacter sp. RAF43]|uniref:hypothetical protein n=1 Tax=Specibacter sp. RAF43 TaxID=3233057 RepID=UPI003F9DA4E1
MTAILQWTTLAVCFACMGWRLPATLKGRNVSLFWCFALVTVCVGLSIPEIYLPVDGLLGGRNIANLMLRLGLFALFFLLAAKIATAYGSPFARQMIRGPIGLAVVTVASLAVVVCFALADLRGSRTGLAGFPAGTALGTYMLMGRLYPAYAAACLIWPTLRAGLTIRPWLDKSAALLMSCGFATACLTLLVQLTPLHAAALLTVLSYGAILCVAVGLSLVWLSYSRQPRGR